MTPSDFLRPVGRLDPEWLGGLTEATNTLGALIAHAGTVTDNESAQSCWVYWQAFRQVADDLMLTPATQRDRDKSDSYSADQLAYFERAARDYEACFNTRVSGGGTRLARRFRRRWSRHGDRGL